MKHRRQLFVISRQAFLSMSVDAVQATVEAMKEAGVYALPYDSVDVRIFGDVVSVFHQGIDPGQDVRRSLAAGELVCEDGIYRANYGDVYWVQFDDVSLDHNHYIKKMVFEGYRRYANHTVVIDPKEVGDKFAPSVIERDAVAGTLVTLLATRNAVKETTHRKAAGLGIGSRKGGIRSYEYVTTITVPDAADMEDDEDSPAAPGAAKACHLRRGHVRRQKYGSGLLLTRSIFIQPVLVNADAEWVRQRGEYRL